MSEFEARLKVYKEIKHFIYMTESTAINEYAHALSRTDADAQQAIIRATRFFTSQMSKLWSEYCETLEKDSARG